MDLKVSSMSSQGVEVPTRIGADPINDIGTPLEPGNDFSLRWFKFKFEMQIGAFLDSKMLTQQLSSLP